MAKTVKTPSNVASRTATVPVRNSLRVFAWILLTFQMLLQNGYAQDKAVGNEVVDLLCEHISKNRKKFIVDTNQPTLIWSDGAIFEVGTNFPPRLQALILRPTHTTVIHAFVKELEAGSKSGWKTAFPGLVQREKRYVRIIASDRSISVQVERVYLEYLNQTVPPS